MRIGRFCGFETRKGLVNDYWWKYRTASNGNAVVSLQ